MNLTENQLRAVLRDAGDEISPDRVRPLDLQSQRAPRLAARDRSQRLRRSRWLQGLAAAAAVAAVAIASTVIATGTGGHRTGSTPGAGAPGPKAHVGGVPPYYVLVAVPPRQSVPVATVRNTRTSAVLTTVRPPKGYWFIGAAAGADNDTFLLEANQHSERPGLYLLQFNPARRTTSLTRLPIPVTLYAGGLAVSPNGSEVAVASGTNTGRFPSKLQIYTLSGTLVRQWQDPGTICLLGSPCLSWAASGYLAFTWNNNGKNVAVEGIRLIPATAASGSLLGTSRLVVPFKTDYSDFVLSGDGATIAADVQLRPAPGKIYNSYEEFSTATGKLTARYYLSLSIDVGSVYWSNWTGSELIVAAPYPRTSRNPRWPLGILARGKFTPLPTPAGIFALAF
jgi:DNA-binding beta-propeller fold protein YncE